MRVGGFWLRVEGLKFRSKVDGAGCKVQVAESRVWGLGLRNKDSGLGSRV